MSRTTSKSNGWLMTSAPRSHRTSEDDFQNISVTPLRDDDTVYKNWVSHWSADRPGTEVSTITALKAKYPDHSLVVSSERNLHLDRFPEAKLTALSGVEAPLTDASYVPATRRIDGPGGLVDDIQFGQFRVEWRNEVFIVVITSWSETFSYTERRHFILRKGTDEGPTRALIISACAFVTEVRDEILVYSDGSWRKDRDLWEEVQKGGWQDVIMDEEYKERIQKDIDGFFASEKIFKDLHIPWKRGIIFLGPPGNGKTISIKSIMKQNKNPNLYVKSFKSWKGEEASIRDVFTRARQSAPCILILEDLDSLINDQNRSFFLNELDGLEGNDGLLVIGSTNHIDRIDPALSNRPSRFDRQYEFNDPSLSERILYSKYWQRKLRTNKSIVFTKTLVEQIARETHGFSFAYLKEAFVSSLVILAGDSNAGTFEQVILAQIDTLRKQIEHKEPRAPRALPQPHPPPHPQ